MEHTILFPRGKTSVETLNVCGTLLLAGGRPRDIADSISVPTGISVVILKGIHAELSTRIARVVSPRADCLIAKVAGPG